MWDKQRHGATPACDCLRDRRFEPERQPMASAGRKHHQVWLLFFYLANACLNRIALRTHFRHRYGKLFIDSRTRAAGRQHVPPLQSPSDRGKLRPITDTIASRVHNDQFGLAEERDRQRMSKCQLTGLGKIRRMENRIYERHRVCCWAQCANPFKLFLRWYDDPHSTGIAVSIAALRVSEQPQKLLWVSHLRKPTPTSARGPTGQ